MSAVWSNWLKRFALARRRTSPVRRLSARPQCRQLEARETPATFSGGISVALGSAGLVAGAGPGGVPLIAVHNPTTGAIRASFLAFNADFTGGVNVATAGNFIAVGAGAGGVPLVRIFDASGNPIASLLAFDAAFSGGVRVALADVSGDGIADIITAAGPGGAPGTMGHVKVFNGANLALLRDFLAFPEGFAGGVSIAAADLNGDGRAEIVAGAGAGGMPMVAVFDGATGQQTSSFLAFPQGFNGGITVSATSLNGGRIGVGASAGGQPVMAAFNSTGTPQQSMLAFDAGFTGGIFIGSADVNNDGTPDVAVGAGPGGSPVVRVFNGATVQSFADFFAFEGPRDTTPPVPPPNDTTAPTITFFSPPAGGTFPDNVTITGRVTDNVGVTSFQAQQTPNGQFTPVSVDANGNFTFTTTYPTGTSGAQTVTFRASDAAGNTTNTPFAFTITPADNIAPVVTITRPPQNQTFTTNPVIGGTVTDNVAVTLLEASVDNGTFQAVTFNATTGEWEFTPSLPTDGTANGAHAVRFRARDAAGNVSAIATFNFTLNASPDTTAPVITLINSPDGQTVATNPTVTGTVLDGESAVTLLEVSVDGGAFASVPFNNVTGSFNFTTSLALDGTDDGLHTLDFRATNAAGLTSALTTISFTLDTTPDTTAPTVTITTQSGQTFQNNPTIQGTVTDNVAVTLLEASVDGGAFQSVTFDPATGAFSFTTSLPLDGTALGNHTVQFRATDAAGNVSTPVDFTFTLEADTTAPTVTITTQSGQTFQINPTIEGTAIDNVGVTLLEASLDGGAFQTVTFDPATGAFSYTTSLPLDGTALGNHTVQFRATDAAGNVSTPVDFTFTLEADTTAPTVTITTQSGQTFVINPTIEGTAIDNVGVTLLEASLDGGAFQTVTFDPATGAFSFTTSLPLDGSAVGNHTVQFRATDAAGNVSTPVDFTFTLEADTTAPTVAITTQSGQTFVVNPTIQGTVTDNVAVTLLEASVDGGAFQSVTFDPATGAFSFTTSLPLDGTALGNHTVQFRASDAAGNVSTPVDFTFTLEADTTAPTVTITTQSGQTFQINPTIEGTVTDNGTVASLEASVDGGAFVAVTFDPATGAFTFTTSLPLDGTALGNHTVQFRATDGAGNVSTPVDFTFTLEADTTAPVVTITSPPTGQTFQTNPTIQGTVTDNVGVTLLEVSVDGAAFQSVTFDPATGAFTFTTSLPLDGSAVGSHNVVFRATDAAGNVSNVAEIDFTLEADTTAPVVTITTPSGQTLSASPAIMGTVTDNVGVATLEASVDGGTFVAVTFDPATGAFTFTPTVTDGPHTIQFRASDAAGNISTVVDFTFTLDTIAPVVTITNPAPNQTFPTNVTVQGTATDNDTLASVEFSIDGGAFTTVLFDPATGAYGFTTNLATDGSDDGPHTVVVRATDAAGNVSSASVTFTLNADQTAPVVTITNPAPNQTFPTNVTVQGTVTDAQGVATLEMSVDGGTFTAVQFDPATGAYGFTTTLATDGSADGPHTVVVRATDVAGNVTSESVTFILDTTGPTGTITSPQPNQPFNTNPTVQGTATDAVSGLFAVDYRVDGGSFQSVTFDPATGAFSFTPNLPLDGTADGTHLIEVAFTDAAGNVSVQSVSFVLDTTAPTVVIASPPDGQTFPTNVSVLGTTSDNRAVVTLEYRLDGGAWITVLFDPLTGAWGFTTNLPTDGSADGPHTIEVRAMDAAGNATSVFLTFTLDVP